MSADATLVHATAIALDGMGLLLMGPSGSGKSDLAMRLIDRGAVLVCDDYCDIVECNGQPMIVGKSSIAGKIELRGVGILNAAHVPRVPLELVIELDRSVERLPDPTGSIKLAGWAIASYPVQPFEASAPIKVEKLLRQVIDAGRKPVRLDTSDNNWSTG